MVQWKRRNEKYLRRGLCDKDKIAYFQSEESKGKHRKTEAQKELATKRYQINKDVRQIFNSLTIHMGYDPRQSLDGNIVPVVVDDGKNDSKPKGGRRKKPNSYFKPVVSSYKTICLVFCFNIIV